MLTNLNLSKHTVLFSYSYAGEKNIPVNIVVYRS